jgi:hypothetical protein
MNSDYDDDFDDNEDDCYYRREEDDEDEEIERRAEGFPAFIFGLWFFGIGPFGDHHD